MNEPLINADTLLCQAKALTCKPVYGKDDSARVDALIRMAQVLQNRVLPGDNSEEFRAVADLIRCGATNRDLGTNTLTQTTTESIFVHQLFFDKLTQALKAYDAMFDPEVVTVYPTDTGAPVNVPQWDDTANAATQVAEGQQDALAEPSLLTLQLPAAPTFRTGILKFSWELLEDLGFPIVDELARMFAWRLGRGIGPSLVTQLLSQAPVALTASGSSVNTGGSETGGTSVGWADLCGLAKSVNSAYRTSPKCGWLMASDTLLTIDSIVTRYGSPMVNPEYDSQGRQLLLGFPVNVCPSLPALGLSNKPIAFGDLGYFVTRTVKNSNNVIRLRERFADLGQVGFRSMLRCNGALRCASAGQVPVKVLQNASS